MTPAIRELRLTHPDLDFWIEVRVRDFGGRWLAVADLAGQPEVGVGETVDAALNGALNAFEVPLRTDLRESAKRALNPDSSSRR